MVKIVNPQCAFVVCAAVGEGFYGKGSSPYCAHCGLITVELSVVTLLRLHLLVNGPYFKYFRNTLRDTCHIHYTVSQHTCTLTQNANK